MLIRILILSAEGTQCTKGRYRLLLTTATTGTTAAITDTQDKKSPAGRLVYRLRLGLYSCGFEPRGCMRSTAVKTLAAVKEVNVK